MINNHFEFCKNGKPSEFLQEPYYIGLPIKGWGGDKFSSNLT
jgi:hypothetical protein